ncbi:RelA/SpoT [Sphingopyxis fribergensis]|uniref:RelA/SpoT n=1 Tax=Sphingopyxis fribergensis TaxID=1515612 RepID=A0A0A7PJC5_9SPHN|nr:RelA/SpoT domain-containing protein [Sphingopyxis fribergensis]AJA09333.1 RelA/SpoT [Sphingopyxis fribergensis]
MTRESDLLDRWNVEKDAYLAWGHCIADAVKDGLRGRLSVDVDYFLKIHVTPRLKDGHKLVEKAFYRPGKNYQNPYEEITDKVGIRLVVLLGSDMKLVQEVLTSIQGWSFSKDRDHEEERKARPIEFDYAAFHYVVRPNEEFSYGDIVVPKDIPCEVQIKTILQHAYSELTHDTIYKPQVAATPIMQRNAAKSMALLEATNDYFERVTEDVNKALASVRELTRKASEVYQAIVGVAPKPNAIEGLLAGSFEKFFTNEFSEQINDLVRSKPYIPQKIRDHLAERNPIFSQPSVLLVYLAASANYREAIRDWPMTTSQLEPLLNDIGESADG